MSRVFVDGTRKAIARWSIGGTLTLTLTLNLNLTLIFGLTNVASSGALKAIKNELVQQVEIP